MFLVPFSFFHSYMSEVFLNGIELLLLVQLAVDQTLG